MAVEKYHDSVLLEEALSALHIQKGGKYIDATLGAGGHTIEILIKGGDVLGIDQDKSMLEFARKKIEKACPPDKKFVGSKFLVHANFKRINELARKYGFYPADGILMDLGISSLHLDRFQRGFSFREVDSPLDMRLDEDLRVKAYDLLNALDKKSLIELFSEVENFKNSRNLADLILKRRREKSFFTVSDFLELFGHGFESKKGLHPATKAFAALRIAVNTEITTLEETLPNAFETLATRGRMVVISFHSGEDRIVKNFFKKAAAEKKARELCKKPIVPDDLEKKKNKRSRSAKMRVLEKL